MERKSLGFYIVLVVLVLVIAALGIDLAVNLSAGKKGTGTDADSAVVELAVQNGEVVHRPVRDFDAFVNAAGKPVFVDFWASWCGPCVSAAPFVETLAKEFDGKVLFLKVNVDAAGDLANRYQASSIPLFVILRDGRAADSSIGYADSIQDSIRAMIQKQLDS
jgi:thioredoxin 1